MSKEQEVNSVPPSYPVLQQVDQSFNSGYHQQQPAYPGVHQAPGNQATVTMSQPTAPHQPISVVHTQSSNDNHRPANQPSTVVVVQPGTVHVQASSMVVTGPGQWNSGVMDCFTDVPSC